MTRTTDSLLQTSCATMHSRHIEPTPGSSIAAWNENSGCPTPFRQLMGGAGTGNTDVYSTLGNYGGREMWGGYGQMEVCGLSTAMDLDGMLERPTNIGWALPHVRLAVLDDQVSQRAPLNTSANSAAAQLTRNPRDFSRLYGIMSIYSLAPCR